MVPSLDNTQTAIAFRAWLDAFSDRVAYIELKKERNGFGFEHQSARFYLKDIFELLRDGYHSFQLTSFNLPSGNVEFVCSDSDDKTFFATCEILPEGMPIGQIDEFGNSLSVKREKDEWAIAAPGWVCLDSGEDFCLAEDDDDYRDLEKYDPDLKGKISFMEEWDLYDSSVAAFFCREDSVEEVLEAIEDMQEEVREELKRIREERGWQW